MNINAYMHLCIRKLNVEKKKGGGWERKLSSQCILRARISVWAKIKAIYESRH